MNLTGMTGHQAAPAQLLQPDLVSTPMADYTCAAVGSARTGGAMGGRETNENHEFVDEFEGSRVTLSSVPMVHPETALQKVAGRWLAATPDDRLHTFENAEGVSEVGERIIELIDGVRTVEQISESIHKEFDVPRASAEQDTRQFIELLISKQVLRAS